MFLDLCLTLMSVEAERVKMSGRVLEGKKEIFTPLTLC